jgi:DNA polymerase-3 subunit beta
MQTKTGARLSIERAKFDLVSMPIDEFPLAEAHGSPPVGSLDGREFISTLRRIATHSSGHVEARPSMCGVHLVSQGGPLALEATDGTHLAREEIAAPGMGPIDVIVPAMAVSALGRLFATATDLRVQLESNHFIVSGTVGGDRVQIITRTIEGPFVQMAPVVNQPLPHTARVDRLALLAAIKRVSALAGGDEVRIRLDWRADHVVVGARGKAETGSGEDIVSCEYDGPPLAIYFQPRYAVDAFAVRTADVVEVGLKSAERAMSVRDAGATGPQNLAMPIRVPE